MKSLIALTEEEIVAAETEARRLIESATWPVIWAIGAENGWVDSLGGAEYRASTAERDEAEITRMFHEPCKYVIAVVQDLLKRGVEVAIPFPSNEYDLVIRPASTGEWQTVKVLVDVTGQAKTAAKVE